MKDKLTIIISAHERQKSLNRLLPYLSSYGWKVIVTDSTPTPFSNIPENVEYLHNVGKNFYENVYSGLEKVTTPYVVHLNDDDFILNTATLECVEFLEENPDYVMAQGLMLKFFENDHRILKNYGITQFYLQTDPGFLAKYNMTIPMDRVKFMFDTFISPNHAVIRTEVLKKSFQIPLKYNEYYPIRFFDKIIGIMLGLSGKTKTLNNLYQLRSSSRLITNEEYPDELKRDKSFSEFVKLIQIENAPIYTALSEKSEVSENNIKERLGEILSLYSENHSENIRKLFLELKQKTLFEKMLFKKSIIEKIYESQMENYKTEIKTLSKLVEDFPLE